MPNVTVTTTGGFSIVLEPLQVDQVMALVDSAADRARSRLVADLTDAKVTGEPMLEKLREFDRTRDLGRDLVRECFSLRASAVIKAALRNGTKYEDLVFDREAAALSYAALDLLDVPWRNPPADPTTDQIPSGTGGSK